ncbi:MAG: FMN-binding protein [Porticoccaceae bacterium]|nr:FMN-binding protein [Porticoccaceae bacterium]
MKKAVFIIAICFLNTAIAKGVYQTPLAFIKQAFGGNTPSNATIWLTKERKQTISSILQHPPGYIRVKYWQHETRTAWILNEIGKEKPITVGVTINAGEIEQLKVLTFRESRGWEVKHDFFTRQFNNSSIDNNLHLNQSVDGISGATLSVRALKKVARIALYLEQQIQP